MSYRSLSGHCHNFVWDRENSVFLLCLCLWWEVWEGSSEGLFLSVVIIFIESLRFNHWVVASTLVLGWVATCPFSLSAVEVIPTSQHACLLSSEVCIAWAHHSLADGNCQDILENVFIAVSSGGYNCCKLQDFTKHYLQPQMKEKSTLVTVTGFHGLYMIVGFAFIVILFLIPTKMSLYFF